MSVYEEDNLLLLSGIQHMAFCERQWALIHIEQVWAENSRTLEGKFLHEKADDPFKNETRSDLRIVRAMPIVSYKLGLRGVADVVEFRMVENSPEGIAVKLNKRKGWWQPFPIEYKRGRPKRDDRDAVQLCAQAICLEEMLKISIDCGFLFYGQTKRREKIYFNHVLRKRVEELAGKMQKMFVDGKTPRAHKGKHCSLCSLTEQCQPNLTIRHRSVEAYLQRMLDWEEIKI
ncbi:CRISPR-associated protein Cas4 [Desulfosporosinus sp. Tol-M]|nr:CRISPR-associated protein Cas4 [Desulfosporosinus sp. Tol-M]